jgi:MFS family permease
MKDGSVHWAWVILGVCFLDLFVNYAVRLGYGVLLPEMLRDLALSRTAGGSIFNAYLFIYITLTPLAGFLTDRLGARPVITVCSAVLGVGVLFMGAARSAEEAAAAFAFVGLGAAGIWVPVLTVAQRWFAPSRRGLALGILSTGIGLGFAVTGILFPFIIEHEGWRFAWVVLGATALALSVINGVLLRSTPESLGNAPWGGGDRGARPGPESPAGLLSRGGIFRRGDFWWIGLSYFCVAFSLYGITTFMVDYARHQIGMEMARASLLATIHGAGQVIGVLAILPLSDLLGRKTIVLFSNFTIAAAIGGILLSSGSVPLVFFFVGLMAVFYGVTFPIYGACAGDYFSEHVIGTVIGAWTPFYGLGAIASHWLGGMLRDATGRYDEAFALNALMAFAAFLLFFAVGRPRPQGRREPVENFAIDRG